MLVAYNPCQQLTVAIVPIIVVFSKNDLYIAAAKNRIMQENDQERGDVLQKHSEEIAARRYKEECLELFKYITTHPQVDIAGKLVTHILVARTSSIPGAILLMLTLAQSHSMKPWKSSSRPH
jgi:hypothetical protein